MSWNINTTCNYRCSYCTQRFLDDRGRWSRDTPRFLAAFGRLPGRWEVKISGGEPFVHPTLLEITAGLAQLGHRVSIVTNFSAPRDKLLAFVAAAMGRVGVFSCSLHLEYVVDDAALGDFIDRARAVQDALRAAADPGLPEPSVCVTCVATRDALPRLADLDAGFSAAGLVFKVQPEKQDGAVVAYESDAAALLRRLGGHNRTGALQHDFLGRPCWAGSRYFILDDRGLAYRCYPARRAHRKAALWPEVLGDFLSPEFRLAEAATPCRYDFCNCTVPIERKMMTPREDVT